MKELSTFHVYRSSAFTIGPLGKHHHGHHHPHRHDHYHERQEEITVGVVSPPPLFLINLVGANYAVPDIIYYWLVFLNGFRNTGLYF